MSSKKHSKTAVDLNRAYEENEVGLKGIVSFAVGLMILIVITFGLMWALLNVLKDYDKENAGPANPLAMSEREKLPAEPRLQSAPGFGVDTAKGRVVLELREPQAEYRELQKEWANLWEKGLKDQKTGVVTAMPIDEAKAKLLTLNVKARSGPEAESAYANSQAYISEAGAGRMATSRRR